MTIEGDGRRLRIENASVSDTGAYTCVARNPAGQDSLSYDIQVYGRLVFYAYFSDIYDYRNINSFLFLSTNIYLPHRLVFVYTVRTQYFGIRYSDKFK